jgi:quercetin dioxygenase-like cupin family protein
MMRSLTRRAAISALGVLAALGAGRRATAAAAAQACAPELPAGAAERITLTPIATGLPAAAPNQRLTLYRFTMPPGEALAVHSHPGATMLQIESGELTYRVVRGEVLFWSGEGVERLDPRPVAAGETVTFLPGDAIFYDADTAHDAVNSGDVPVAVLSVTLLDVEQPSTIFEEPG